MEWINLYWTCTNCISSLNIISLLSLLHFSSPASSRSRPLVPLPPPTYHSPLNPRIHNFISVFNIIARDNGNPVYSSICYLNTQNTIYITILSFPFLQSWIRRRVYFFLLPPPKMLPNPRLSTNLFNPTAPNKLSINPPSPSPLN